MKKLLIILLLFSSSVYGQYVVSDTNQYTIGSGGTLGSTDYFTVGRPRTSFHYVNGYFFYSDNGGTIFSGNEFMTVDTASLTDPISWDGTLNTTPFTPNRHMHFTVRNDSLWLGGQTPSGNETYAAVVTVNPSTGAITFDMKDTVDEYAQHVNILKLIPIGETDVSVGIFRGGTNSYDFGLNITSDNGTTWHYDSTTVAYWVEGDSSSFTNRLGGAIKGSSACAFMVIAGDSAGVFNFDPSDSTVSQDGNYMFTSRGDNSLSRMFNYGIVQDSVEYFFVTNPENTTNDSILYAYKTLGGSTWTEGIFAIDGGGEFDGDGTWLHTNYIESLGVLCLFYARNVSGSADLFMRTFGLDGTPSDEIAITTGLDTTNDAGVAVVGLRETPSHLGNKAYVVFQQGNSVELMEVTVSQGADSTWQDADYWITSLPCTLSASDHSVGYDGAGGTKERDTVRIEGTSATSTESGIYVFSSGWDIILDNDTIIFGTDSTFRYNGSDAAKGITLHPTYNPDSILIKGGYILHQPENIGDYPGDTIYHDYDTTNANCHGISMAGDCDYITIDSVREIKVKGIQSGGISGGGHQILIRNSKIVVQSYGFADRQDFLTAGYYTQSDDDDSLSGSETYNTYIYGCSFETYSHVGIYCGYKTTGSPNFIPYKGGVYKIEACTIKVDARNYYAGNDSSAYTSTTQTYGILMVLAEGSNGHVSSVKDCYIYSGQDWRGGRGIGFYGVRGKSNNYAMISGNRLIINEGKSSQYAALVSAVSPIKIRQESQYVKCSSNVITLVMDTTTAEGDAYLPSGEAIVYQQWEDSADMDFTEAYVIIENNRCSTLVLSPDASATQDYNGASFKFDFNHQPDTTSYSRYNYYVSYANHIYDYGQFDGAASGTLVYGDTVVLLNDGKVTSDTATFNLGGYGYPSMNNMARDLIYMENASPSSVSHLWRTAPASTGTEKEIEIYKTMVITVNDTLDNPVENANISIVNNYGDTVSQGVTDALGAYSDLLMYNDFFYTISDSTGFNDFTLVAALSGDSAIGTYTVDWNRGDTTLVLSATEGASTTTNKKLRKIYIRKGKI